MARSTYGLTVVAASETLSFVLAIFDGSFRLLAKAFLPFALLFILSGCGGSTGTTAQETIGVRGNGFVFELPQGWTVERPPNAVVGKRGSELVSVTRFDLRKAYDPKTFDAVAKTLD